MTTYTVRYAQPTGIPGYAPEYTAAQGVDFGTAHEWALALAKTVANNGEYAIPQEPAFYVALRDGATEATLEVWSHQSYVHLGRPFTPALLGTVTVTAEQGAGR
jgi:hypothetical protein